MPDNWTFSVSNSTAQQVSTAKLAPFSAHQPRTRQMSVDPIGKAVRVAANIVDYDWHNCPTNILDAGDANPVSDHFVATGMPNDALILRGEAFFRPGEIHAPRFPIAPTDRILKLG